MAPSQYLLHVNSRPTSVSNDLWRAWYKYDHLPDLVKSKACDRAALYEETPSPIDQHPHHRRKFLALYQTSIEDLLNTKEYERVRTTSDLFAKEGYKSTVFHDHGDFDARYYTLSQDFDPLISGDNPSPQILTVYMNPKDPDDFEKWYREEHLHDLAKLPGYRRPLRYNLTATQTSFTEGSGPEEVQPRLAIHEIDDVAVFGPSEAISPWTKRNIENSRPMIIRAWKLVSAAVLVKLNKFNDDGHRKCLYEKKH